MKLILGIRLILFIAGPKLGKRRRVQPNIISIYPSKKSWFFSIVGFFSYPIVHFCFEGFVIRKTHLYHNVSRDQICYVFIVNV